MVERDTKPYGSTDLWSFDLLEVGRRLPCGNIRTFLHYLCSEGTHSASIEDHSTMSGTVEVIFTGPRADNGVPLSVSYLLTGEEIHGDGMLHEGLEEWEKRLLVNRLKACDSGSRFLGSNIKALLGALNPMTYAA